MSFMLLLQVVTLVVWTLVLSAAFHKRESRFLKVIFAVIVVIWISNVMLTNERMVIEAHTSGLRSHLKHGE